MIIILICKIKNNFHAGRRKSACGSRPEGRKRHRADNRHKARKKTRSGGKGLPSLDGVPPEAVARGGPARGVNPLPPHSRLTLAKRSEAVRSGPERSGAERSGPERNGTGANPGQPAPRALHARRTAPGLGAMRKPPDAGRRRGETGTEVETNGVRRKPISRRKQRPDGRCVGRSRPTARLRERAGCRAVA